MKVLIIEDENSVARNLCDILRELESKVEVLAIIESVSDAVNWLSSNPKPDLGFSDIRLADGDSFEIFEQSDIHFPIIFTSAYDEYALKAFEVNSVDYLVKPINKKALQNALDKYKSIYSKEEFDYQNLLRTIADLHQSEEKQYQKSLLVYYRDQILPIPLDSVAYFHLRNELVSCITHENKCYTIDQTLEKINNQINPKDFFRANRQFIISRRAVNAASQYFQRRLKINITPPPNEDLIINKTKVNEFKEWLTK